MLVSLAHATTVGIFPAQPDEKSFRYGRAPQHPSPGGGTAAGCRGGPGHVILHTTVRGMWKWVVVAAAPHAAPSPLAVAVAVAWVLLAATAPSATIHHVPLTHPRVSLHRPSHCMRIVKRTSERTYLAVLLVVVTWSRYMLSPPA